MKTILYVSLTANGRLGQRDDVAHVIPSEILADFIALVLHSGNVIIGRRTYDLLAAQAGFAQILTDVKIVVVSGHIPALDGATAVPSPQAALEVLDEHAFATAVVGGGAQLDGAFLSEGLVDELYVNVIPSVTGSGLMLPLTEGTEITLRVIDGRRLTGDIFQIHYAVDR